MNKEETEKFNQIISEGFFELIKTRPEKPLEHFIFFLMSSLPENTKEKDKNLFAFFKKYESSLEIKSDKHISTPKNLDTGHSLDNSAQDYDYDNISN